MKLRRLLAQWSSRIAAREHQRRQQLQIETLESRLVPYAVSGNAWTHPELVTLSFMPDGTNLGGVTSNLFSTMNAQWSQATWQREILRAAQVWAQVTNLNFALVNDNGAASGGGDYQQGDPGLGDIRVGAYSSAGSNLGSAMMPPPANNYSVAGDFTLNASQPWVINQTGGYDLFTVAAHEIGHTLGLYHSAVSAAEEYSFYSAVKPTLRSDDIAGIRAIYSGGLGRSADIYDAVLANNSFLTATNLTASIDLFTKTALVQDLDLTTTGDHDYYSFLAPVGTTGSLTVEVQSSGLSMLMPTVTVYNALQQPIGSASGLGQYGSTLSVTVNGVTAGQLFYVKVAPAETSAFGTGKYALTLNFGSGASPTVPLPNTQTANGSPIQGGGGIAIRSGIEMQVNTTTTGSQTTYSDRASRNAVAMASGGGSVVTWSSQDQDGAGVFARVFGPDGTPGTDEFQVNTHTANDQHHAVVAQDDFGNFVIAWASEAQDPAGGWGVYARRFSSLGQPLGGEFAVGTGPDDQAYPSVAVAGDGSFVIGWADKARDGSGWGVAAQRYDVQGLPAGGAFVVNTTTAGDQTQAAVARDLSGNFVATWTGADGYGQPGVFAKVYDAAGAVLRDEFLVSESTVGHRDNPAVAMADDGDFVVTWSSYGQDGSGWGIYARRFTPDGQARGAAFRVNDHVNGNQWFSAIAMLANGDTVIAWTSDDTSGGNAGILAREFSAAGVPVGDEMLVNTTQNGNQWYPSVAASDADGFGVVWSGEGIGDTDGVFAQRFQFTSTRSGVAGAEDDFYGIADHGGGCGCATCQAAAVVAGATPDAAALNGLLHGLTMSATPDAAHSTQPPAVVLPAASDPVGRDALPVPETTSLPGGSRTAIDTFVGTEQIDPAPILTPPDTSVPAELAHSAGASAPLGPTVGAWVEALDLHFAEEAAWLPASVSASADQLEGEPVLATTDATPLAGLGLVLGGLWFARPEPAKTHKREQGRRLVGSNS